MKRSLINEKHFYIGFTITCPLPPVGKWHLFHICFRIKLESIFFKKILTFYIKVSKHLIRNWQKPDVMYFLNLVDDMIFPFMDSLINDLLGLYCKNNQTIKEIMWTSPKQQSLGNTGWLPQTSKNYLDTNCNSSLVFGCYQVMKNFLIINSGWFLSFQHFLQTGVS